MAAQRGEIAPGARGGGRERSRRAERRQAGRDEGEHAEEGQQPLGEADRAGHGDEEPHEGAVSGEGGPVARATEREGAGRGEIHERPALSPRPLSGPRVATSARGRELERMEAPEHAVLAQELVVGAFLHDAALVEHGDPVGEADGGQAVRDEDDGPALGEIGESLLHDVLALGVEIGGGLVQDEDRGILQERSREGDPLPLPPGELHAALPGQALVAVGHRDDEVVGVGGPGGALDLLRAWRPALP